MSTAPRDAVTPKRKAVVAALGVCGERWSLLVILEISQGVHRFGEILEATGAPRNTLANRLHKLQSAGLLERRLYSTQPSRYEYHLTDAGHDLEPVLAGLSCWGDRWVLGGRETCPASGRGCPPQTPGARGRDPLANPREVPDSTDPTDDS
ncbi:DNA-binding HxlR family transcriptional regulator [Streptomyces aurantiacus]|uniref:winged helix-turn-helix transcriptional regulator n=1 Tax=Streptomyces aurantiacus TaxID=47760 RepID=UPI00278CDBF8|nr:helix-turn-helix domain-containing protein [Streptomyces aurantiacus]MDQ0771773.1 DNA-binding HxlR family transcriptional regulator [Streptomyces aurantiacus]